jgi:2-haloacid dehalogenase
MTLARPFVAFDVFGTLVDPEGLIDPLRALVGERAHGFAAEWRRRQVEYLFRRAAMGQYRPFAAVTADALADTATLFETAPDAATRTRLLDGWWKLPPLPDAADALARLAGAGFPLIAFSNGAVADVERLLVDAGLREPLKAVHGVEASASYKPAAVVYQDLASALDVAGQHVWLVSANFWDASGARAAGLNSVWIARGRAAEHWEWQPTEVVEQLADLAARPEMLAL